MSSVLCNFSEETKIEMLKDFVYVSPALLICFPLQAYKKKKLTGTETENKPSILP